MTAYNTFNGKKNGIGADNLGGNCASHIRHLQKIRFFDGEQKSVMNR